MVKKLVVQWRLSLFQATLVGSVLLEPKGKRRMAVKSKWSIPKDTDKSNF